MYQTFSGIPFFLPDVRSHRGGQDSAECVPATHNGVEVLVLCCMDYCLSICIHTDCRAEVQANKRPDFIVFHIHFIKSTDIENVAQEIAFTDACNGMLLCIQNGNCGITVPHHYFSSLPDSLLFVEKDRAARGIIIFAIFIDDRPFRFYHTTNKGTFEDKV